MQQISFSRAIWRRFSIWWVMSPFLAPFIFGWFGSVIVSSILGAEGTLGFIVTLGIVLSSMIAVSTLAKAEVETAKKDFADSGMLDEIQSVIMEAARKAQKDGGVTDNVSENRTGPTDTPPNQDTKEKDSDSTV